MPEQFTLIGFAQNQDTGNNLTLVNALADPHMTVMGKLVTVPADLPYLLGVFAGGLNISQARVSSPSLLSMVLPDIAPLNRSSRPYSPAPYLDMFENPIPLVPAEQLSVLVAETATGAEWEWVLVWLGRGAITPYRGPYWTVRAVGSTTLTPYTWTNVPITLTQTLPAGRYQLVGLRAESANAIAARAVFPGGTWRPGVIAFETVAAGDPLRFRFGNAGVLGEFAHNQPPTIDFLSTTADTTEVVHLDVAKIA